MTTKEIHLSENAKQIKGSITMSISALAGQLKAEGKDVIGMSAGEPDFDTPDYIKEAATKALSEGKTGYTPAAGIIELKQAVCDKFKRDQGLTYKPSEVLISCGAKHSIFNIFFATLNPGDEVLIPTPYWVSYPDQAKMFGATPVTIETSSETSYKITPEQLEAAITPRTKLLILNSPSNPTGMVYTRAELEALAAVIEKHDFLVISDEIYEKLIYDGEHISIASLSEKMKSQTLVVNGLSKAYAMTGWRLGYLAGPQDLVSAMGRLQSHSTSNPTSFAQWGAVEALNGGEEAIDEMKVSFVRRRDLMVDGLNAIPGITCLKPQGAFYAFANISGLFGKSSASGTITDSVSFCEQLLQDALVACVPGSGFGSEGHVRLSYATSDEAIKKALDRIRTFAESLS